MVLPDTWSAALVLLIISSFCFVVWPNLFKVSGANWRFELFSIDFSVGAVLVAVIAAYTLGTLGSDLGFNDSLLVAGRRAQLMAFGAGAVFALANLLYLGSIALLGLSNATLLTFSVLGCVMAGLQLINSQYITSGASFVVLAAAAAFTFLSAKTARDAVAGNIRTSSTRSKEMSLSTKGTIAGILTGLALAAVQPVLSLAQTDEFGVGAYGGMLMATLGILIATFFLNFFFMNISLEGGKVSYSDYFSGSIRRHAIGIVSGAFWTAGALALYTAKTSPAKVTGFQAWTAVFAGAFITVISGIVVWQKIKLPAAATRNKFIAVVLFAVGVGLLLFGLQR